MPVFMLVKFANRNLFECSNFLNPNVCLVKGYTTSYFNIVLRKLFTTPYPFLKVQLSENVSIKARKIYNLKMNQNP